MCSDICTYIERDRHIVERRIDQRRKRKSVGWRRGKAWIRVKERREERSSSTKCKKGYHWKSPISRTFEKMMSCFSSRGFRISSRRSSLRVSCSLSLSLFAHDDDKKARSPRDRTSGIRGRGSEEKKASSHIFALDSFPVDLFDIRSLDLSSSFLNTTHNTDSTSCPAQIDQCNLFPFSLLPCCYWIPCMWVFVRGEDYGIGLYTENHN